MTVGAATHVAIAAAVNAVQMHAPVLAFPSQKRLIKDAGFKM